MSKIEVFRVLVTLPLAAEDIAACYERTIVQTEEELCRSQQENQRKQRVLERLLSPRVLLHRLGPAPNQGLHPDLSQTRPIKEEPEEWSVKQEEEELPVSVPESSFQHKPTVPKQEVKREDQEPPFSCSEADEGDHNKVQAGSNKLSPRDKSLPETKATVDKEDTPGTSTGAEKKYQCSICTKTFRSKWGLERHNRVHTGEKPFSCSFCNKTFSVKSNRDIHQRTHTRERPFSCSICGQTFSQKRSLVTHTKTHSGNKAYICSTCQRAFTLKISLIQHMRTHTGEKPFSCSTCNKTFSLKGNLDTHRRIHTGEKPFSCSVCNRSFTQHISLRKHMHTHR